MANANDKKIMDLKKKIEEKKATIKKSKKKFQPITNCILNIEGKTWNIHTLNKGGLRETLLLLNIYRMSAEDLGILEEYKMSGYSLEEWMEDIKSRLSILSVAEEENKLKALESKLTQLLSEDKKTELEIEEIENLL